jgi:2-polyprenyl-6-hydroxyphenyl methylase/3-demethylubiquinone-9 3-methyltransferase
VAVIPSAPTGPGDDCFANHERARRFPWSIYHQPLEDDLEHFLAGVVAARPGARLLVLGCGLMHELDRAPPDLTFTVADIDRRAIDVVIARGDPRCAGGVVLPAETPVDAVLGAGGFDAVYGKEVIEHVVDWPAYLAGLRRALVPGGALWLSTPNYGEPWLPVLERTALDWVARASGFSRRHIHPSRFTRRSLDRGLVDAGFTAVAVAPAAFRLALVATARTADAAG